MINLPVGRIIQDSFALAWRYKYLWVFGLFVSGSFNSGLQVVGGDEGGFQNFEEAKALILAAMAMLLLIAFTIGLVFLVLHVISKSAIIYNVYQIETEGAHNISGGWDFGWKRFWPMLGLTLTTIVIAMVLVLGLGLILVMGFAVAMPLGFLMLLFIVPAGIMGGALLTVTVNYAERFLTLEMRGVFEAIGDGWQLVRSQWKPTALMLLAKVLIAIAATIVFGLTAALLAVPAVALWTTARPMAILYGIGVLIPLVVAAAYLGTFDSSVWTKTFLTLRQPAYTGMGDSATPPPDSGTSNNEPSDDLPPSPPLFE